MRRPPACAGRFYEATAAGLQEQVRSFLEIGVDPVPVKAVICPHAGLMFSGAVAGAVYSRVLLPSIAILIGPNHTGYGPPLSVYAEGEWEVPGGVVPIAAELARTLLDRFPEAQADQRAHQYEHCLEVQLPFLRTRRPDIAVLPIVVGSRSFESCLALGLALVSLIRDAGSESPILIASSDMTHCGPGFGQLPPAGLTADEFARLQDQLALDAVQSLDERRFHATVEERDITMCGYAPTTAVLAAARTLGATRASVIRYATSAEISGDVNRVVGYAGVVIN